MNFHKQKSARNFFPVENIREKFRFRESKPYLSSVFRSGLYRTVSIWPLGSYFWNRNFPACCADWLYKEGILFRIDSVRL